MALHGLWIKFNRNKEYILKKLYYKILQNKVERCKMQLGIY